MDPVAYTLRIIVIVLVPTFIVIFFHSIVKIPPGHVGVIEKRGRPARTLSPGYHLLSPFMSRVHIVDVREKTLEESGETILPEGDIPVRATLKLRYRISDPQKAAHIADPHLAAKKLCQIVIQAVLGDMETEVAVMNIDLVNEKMKNALEKGMSHIGIEVEEVRIKELEITGEVAEKLAKDRECRKMVPRGAKIVVLKGGVEES